MDIRRFGLVGALLCSVAVDGCGKSLSTENGPPDTNSFQACGSATPAPATEVPPMHRSTSQACSPTSADAMPIFTYNATGTPCTTDNQCTSDAGIRGRCLHGACSPDECLTDDDCDGGGVCVCSSPSGSGGGIVENMNYCARGGNCRVDGDCGAGGYCVPSAGVCGFVSGFYCHTPADSCVDPTTDCGTSCLNACHYFPDKGRFACVDFIRGGC